MVPTQLLPALLLLQITRRQSRRLLMFLLMKTKISNLYECEFVSDNTTRRFKVVAQSYGSAATLAYANVSYWEDKDCFELVSIRLVQPVVLGY